MRHSAYKAKPSKLRSFHTEKQRLDVEILRDSRVTNFVERRNFFDFSQKFHFKACICDRTLSVTHYQRFITIGHKGGWGQISTSTLKILPFLIALVLRRLNGAKLALQDLFCLIEHPILCLAFHIRECDPKILKLLHLIQSYTANLQRTLDGIS